MAWEYNTGLMALNMKVYGLRVNAVAREE